MGSYVIPSPTTGAVNLPTSYHVSEYMLGLLKLEHNISVEPAKLNKLCYLVNGFTLRMRNDPAFHDDIEAWKYGPMIRIVYEFYSQYGNKNITHMEISRTPLADKPKVREKMEKLGKILGNDVVEVIHDVALYYGRLDISTLIDMTHGNNTPWKKVYRPGFNNVIKSDIIRTFYRNLDATSTKR